MILLIDANSGIPRLVCNGNVITRLRTAAVGAIALRHLARTNAKRAAIVGAGVQGIAQADAAVRALNELETITVYDVEASRVRRLRGQLARQWKGRVIECKSAEEAVCGADVVITCTPSTQPVIMSAWIEEGVHISAFGADTRGKQEIDVQLIARSKLVVDDVRQALELGESQHAFRAGLIRQSDVYAELGQLTAGLKLGRMNETELTIFDATGLALQDVATAACAMSAALSSGAGQWVHV